MNYQRTTFYLSIALAIFALVNLYQGFVIREQRMELRKVVATHCGLSKA